MAEVTEDQDRREAVQELHEYLSDRISPLLVAESLRLLLQQSDELVASEIWAWTQRQRLAAGNVPVSDFLFHGVKKVALMGDFELIPRAVLAPHLVALRHAVLQYCPVEERELLRQNSDRLDSAAAVTTAPAERIHRAGERVGSGRRLRARGGILPGDGPRAAPALVVPRAPETAVPDRHVP